MRIKFLVGLCLFSLLSFLPSQSNVVMARSILAVNISDIQVNPAYAKNDFTIVPMSTKISSGTFEFNWKIDKKGNKTLVAYDQMGGSERDAMETVLTTKQGQDGTTGIYKMWHPQLNTQGKAELRLVATVNTEKLLNASNVSTSNSINQNKKASNKFMSLFNFK